MSGSEAPLLFLIEERISSGRRERYISVRHGVKLEEVAQISGTNENKLQTSFTKELSTKRETAKLVKVVKRVEKYVIEISIP